MTEKNTELRELIDYASTQAEKIFKNTGRIMPMYHAVQADGQHLVTPTPDADKDVAVALIKSLFRLRNVVRYVYINEAWKLEMPGREPSPAEWLEIQRKGLENHPDRREIMTFFAENRAGELMMAQRYILRPERGKAKLTPLTITDMSGGQTAGRMIGLLKEANNG